MNVQIHDRKAAILERLQIEHHSSPLWDYIAFVIGTRAKEQNVELMLYEITKDISDMKEQIEASSRVKKDTLFTAKQVADMLGVKERTIRNYISQNKIKYFYEGKYLRFKESFIVEFCEKKNIIIPNFKDFI